MSVRQRVRSALTGRFVPFGAARRHPATTVTEDVGPTLEERRQLATLRSNLRQVANDVNAEAHDSSDGYVLGDRLVRRLRELADPPHGVQR